MKIILASKSPRRKEILEKHGYEIEVDASNTDEKSVKADNVKDLVMGIAKLKAEIVTKRHKDAIIVAADTLVYFEGKEIGQAKDEKEAEEVLKKMIGKTHEIFNGICIINTSTGEIMQDLESSKVTLKNVSDKGIKDYIKSEQWKGKAGAYNIDDPEFESFVDKIEGCKFNIKGMPIKKINKMISILDKEV